MIGKNRVRIHPYVRRSLHAELRRHAAKIGATEGAVVEAALRQYLDGASDKALLLGRLDRLSRAEEGTQHQLEILSEIFGGFARMSFAYAPNVPEEAKKAARALGEARCKQLLEFIGTQIGKGRRFVDDLPKELTGDDQPESHAPSKPPPPSGDTPPSGGTPPR